MASKNLSLLLSSLVLCSVSAAYADDLRDIAASSSYKRMTRMTYSQELLRYRGHWTENGEHYSQIFADKGAAKLLGTWLGTSDPTYKMLSDRARAIGTFILLSRTYESSHGREMDLNVLVPHPRHALEAEMGLLKEFQAFEPPMLPVEAKEELRIQNYKGFLFEKKDKRCAVFMKMSRGSIINIDGECSEKDDMIKLANMLSLDRYERMLNS